MCMKVLVWTSRCLVISQWFLSTQFPEEFGRLKCYLHHYRHIRISSWWEFMLHYSKCLQKWLYQAVITCRATMPRVGPGQSPLIPSLPHLLYLLVSFPFFPFLIYASSIFFVFLKMMWCLKMWRMMYVRYLRLRRTFPWQWTVWTLSSILNSLCRLLSAEFSFLAIFVKHLCFD